MVEFGGAMVPLLEHVAGFARSETALAELQNRWAEPGYWADWGEKIADILVWG